MAKNIRKKPILKKKGGTVVNQLVIKAPNRKTYDVGAWRNALQSADRGRVKTLFDLYEDLLIDGVLADAVSKRVDAVTNSELTFQDASGKEVDDITTLINTPDFEELLTQVINTKFWGRSGMELDFTDGMSVFEIPRKHINLDTQQILRQDTDVTGIPYEGDDNILVLGKKRDFGLFLKTAPLIIYKRGGFGDYAQWLEIFGMPQRVGKYSSYDIESRQLLTQALEQAGSAPYIVIPKESEVETTNNTGSGNSGQSYNDFRKACIEETLITILGQTLTTVSGDKGARSLGEVHQDVAANKYKSDIRFVGGVLNHYLLPILERRGFPVTGGKFVFPEDTEPLTVAEVVQLSKIIKIPTMFLHDKYGIPVPSKGDDIAGEVEKSEPDDPDPDDPEKVEPEKEEEKPKKKKRLIDFFAYAPAKERGFGNHLTTLRDSESLDDRVISRINGKDTFDIELFGYFTTRLFDAVQTYMKLADASFVYGAMDDAYKTAMEINIFHFSAAKTTAEITELNRLFRKSKSFDEFYNEASKVAEVFNKTWMETEYDTALLVAESASNYWRLKKQSELFPYWQYTAVMDGKTRESHASLHGVTLPANDPLWKKIMPPLGWRCRCRIKALMKHELPKGYNFDNARALVSEYFETDEWSQVEAQGWGTNRAETAEIFTVNQQYINKFPTKGGAFLDSLTAQKWGLETVPKLIKAAPTNAPTTEQTAKEIWDNHANKEVIKLQLFNSREVTLSKANFDAHTGIKDNRAIYWGALKETIKSPDELWLNNENKIDRAIYKKWIAGGKMDDALAKQLNYDNFNSIRFYNDYAVVATYRVTNGTLELRTWKRLEMDKKEWNSLRRGLYIKVKE